MTEPLQSLWPDDIEAEDVLTPAAILRFQADELKKRTNGRLAAEVETVAENAKATIEFHIIAPTLDNYRYRLFSVVHDVDRVYPAEVFSDALANYPHDEYPATQSEFANVIATVLQSDETRSVIHSLLAKITEASQRPAAQT